MTPPPVTVLMAVHDEERFVGAAVRSILAQTFDAFEFVVVDDGSHDRSREVLGSFADPRLRVVDNPENLGLTRSLNRGLARARGAYVARFDANDVARPDRLARQVAFLDANPDVVAVGSRARQIRPNGAVARGNPIAAPLTRDGIDWALMFYSPLVHPATAFRRSVVEDLGGYDERFTSAQDADLWSRLAAVGRLANLPEALIDLRIVPSSISGHENVRRRLTMVPYMAEVAARNIRRLIGDGPFPDGWPELWTRLICGDPDLAPADAVRALELLADTRARFADVRPSSRDNREIAAQVAFFCRQTAFNTCRRDRRLAAPLFGRATAQAPAHALRDAGRFAARFVLGDSGVRMWRRWAYR